FPASSDDQWKTTEASATSDIEKAVANFRRPVLEVMPDEVPDMLQAGHTIRRAVPRIGRNEPCRCGSGKKYKNCHYADDQKRLHESSEVAGVTHKELYAKFEPHLTEALMKKIGPVEAMRLDPQQIP